VVQTGHFEKFLKMVLQLPHLALEVTLGGCDMLLAGGASFLIITVVTGRGSAASRALLLPLLATSGAFSSALNDGFGWWRSAVACGRFHVA
jgi:hypothetical protein